MQPTFFPWLGYFDLIDTADKFVFYDDVTYIKGGWINRNRIINKNQELLLKNVTAEYENSISFLNEKFDVIMAWGVVEHITDPSLFLSKVYSLLKPAGVFVSEVPHSQSVLVDYCQKSGKDPLRILQGEQHIILYSNKAYSEVHEKSGLKLHHVQTNGLDLSTILGINELEIDQDVISDKVKLFYNVLSRSVLLVPTYLLKYKFY